jgi:LemA protein
MSVTYITLGIVAAFGIWVIFAYNRLVTLVNRAKEAWADIDVQLKRRYDLIPNLVNTVKGYASHEQATLDRITTARTVAMNAQGTAEKGAAENQLTGALKSLFAVSEAYPDLKANQNFLELQRELSDTENKVQAARRFYNQNVMALNTMVESVPSNLVAGIFNFDKMELFALSDADSAAKEPVAVSF